LEQDESCFSLIRFRRRSKLAGWGQAILDKIKTVTDKPVTIIINTHTHGDHVGSNSEFPGTIEFVAHENCKASMEKMLAFQGEDKKRFLPSRTYTSKLSLKSVKDKIDLYYFGRGHTSGDTFIVFPALRTVHVGDLFPAKAAPIMDANNGGSGLEYPKTLKKAARGIKGVDLVITGHNPVPVVKWSDFIEYGQFIQALVDDVQLSFKAGKSADDAASSLKLPEKFKDYNLGRAKSNAAVIYSELKP
jgi:glyoxylase-like metal-dependent hydrolase (beta-lactamase superfamily II)